MDKNGSLKKKNEKKTFNEKKEKDKKKEKDYIPENTIIGKKIVITIEEVKRIEKKFNTICKILKENGENGTGFFCKINIKGKEMKTLFTNNHVLNENNINKNSIIKFMDNNKRINEIKITENRFTYTNEELDYTCIEIFDNEPYNNYLTIDNNINNNNAYEEYKLDKFFIIQFIDSPSFDYGNIQMIDNNKQMYYAISTLPGSSGSPVLNSYRNLSVIGIHCGKVDKGKFKDKCNRGIYFQPILNDILNNFHKKNFKNEIIGIYDIKKNDVNKDINLLNYFESDDDEYKQYNNKKDLENSIELFLDDNQKINFQFKYKFKNEKKYMLIFKIKKPLKNLRRMFCNCSSLTSLNLSNFNTNNYAYIEGMFNGLNKSCKVINNDEKIKNIKL